jgi:hypothetical protein
MITGLAYYNHGRFVVDCPAPGCTDARLVYEVNPQTGVPTGRRLTEDTCAKGHHFEIVMPDPQTEAQIVTVLAERVDDADKDWYPQGHTRALLEGFPTGQSAADLAAENREVARFRSAQQQAKRERMRHMLEEAGIEIRPDGTFEGSI